MEFCRVVDILYIPTCRFPLYTLLASFILEETTLNIVFSVGYCLKLYDALSIDMFDLLSKDVNDL